MLNVDTPQTWVKNVYSLWVKGMITRVNLYTAPRNQHIHYLYQRVQLAFSTKFMNTFPPYLYTAIFRLLTDTINTLSTLSTAPIIKKMN